MGIILEQIPRYGAGKLGFFLSKERGVSANSFYSCDSFRH